MVDYLPVNHTTDPEEKEGTIKYCTEKNQKPRSCISNDKKIKGKKQEWQCDQL